ncbi:MAG: hypothetical protein HC888_05635 [Candidatus Competibacteraceae bacterium]|nr:hypothetical protein [Candidatus Competibacteraceae bacterium]
MVNRKTGEFHILDATSNNEKKSVFKLREDGVIYVNKQFLDTDGSPLVKANRNQEVKPTRSDLANLDLGQRINLLNDQSLPATERAALFLDMLEAKLVKMTSAPSHLKIGTDGPPLPSLKIAGDEDTAKQVSELVGWAKEKAARSNNENEKVLFNDMAAKLAGAETHSELKARELPAPKLAQNLERAIEEELIAYALSRATRVSAPPALGKDKSDIRVFDGNIKLQTEDGNLHDGGSVARAMLKQTNTLSDSATIASRLTDSQLKSLRIKPEQVAELMKPYLERAQSRQTTPIDREKRLEIRAAAMVDLMRSDPSFRKAMDGVKDVLFGLKGDIEGGRVQGERSREIIENALNRMRNKTADSLLGIQENKATPKKEAKPEKLAETMPESAKVLRALPVNRKKPADRAKM